MTKHIRVAGAVAVWVGILFTGSSAAAQSSKDRLAQDHFVAGRAYFEAGRYDEAAKQFEEAYRLSERPALLSNIFRSYERLGDVARAERAFERYRAVDPEAHDLEVLELRLASMRERARQGAPVPQGPDAPSTAEGAPAEEGEPEDDAAAEPAAREGADAADPASDAMVVDGARPSSPGAMRGAGYGLLGLAGASALVALATGLRANGLHGNLVDDCPGGVCDPSLESTADRGQRLSVVSTVFTGVAVASAAVGAVLWLLGRNRGEQAPSTEGARLEWTSGPGMAGLGARLIY